MNIHFAPGLALHAILAAKKGAEKILAVYRSDFAVSYKEDESPLTQADMQSHATICNSLQPTGLPVLSEEGKHIPYRERKKWQYFWMVDPLDGTKEFVKKNDQFAVNIALVEKTHPVLGIICAPVQGKLYFGAKSIGAYRIDDIFAHDMSALTEAIVSKNDAIAQQELEKLMENGVRLPDNPLPKTQHKITLLASSSHRSEKLEQYITKLREKYQTVEVLPMGSSLKFCVLAEGKADIYPRFGSTMQWDTAAGHALVSAVGKEVWQWQEDIPLEYNHRSKTFVNGWFIVR